MINYLMKRKGYILVKEDKYGVTYEKQEPQNILILSNCCVRNLESIYYILTMKKF